MLHPGHCDTMSTKKTESKNICENGKVSTDPNRLERFPVRLAFYGTVWTLYTFIVCRRYVLVVLSDL